MTILIYAGAGLALAGVGLLVWCMLRASRIRKAGGEGPEVEADLRRLIAINMAGTGLGFLGLAVVLAGIILG
ncbi:MAG: hypothetical protein AAGE80_16725 [Pseudomonadota bacterium]